MTHDGKQVHFLLEREWKNYRYSALDAVKAESVLFNSRIIDSHCIHGKTVLMVSTNVFGRNGSVWLFLIESEYDEHKERIETRYSIANVVDDRLPGHRFMTIEDVMHSQKAERAKKLLGFGDES